MLCFYLKLMMKAEDFELKEFFFGGEEREEISDRGIIMENIVISVGLLALVSVIYMLYTFEKAC